MIERSAGPSAVQVFRKINKKLSYEKVVLPIRGRSEVGGIVSDTMFKKNVKERRMVTSAR